MTSVLSTRNEIGVGGAVALDSAKLRKANFLLLDAWRGIAALMVVAYHASLVVVNKQLGGHSNTLYDACGYGWLGVQVFFVISGYCIAASAASMIEKSKPASVFLLARIRRVYPAAWASLVLVLLMTAAVTFLAGRGILNDSSTAHAPFKFNPLCLLSNFTLTQILFRQPFLSPVLWTLCYEIAFYLIVLAALLLRRIYSGVGGLLWIIHTVTVASILAMIVAPHRVIFPFDLWPQFGFGVIVFDWATSPRRGRSLIAAGIIGLLTIVAMAVQDVPLSVMHVSSRLTFGVAAAFALLAVLLKPVDERLSARRPVRVLRWLGMFSYSLYLTHFMVLGMVNQSMSLVMRTPRFHLGQFFLSTIAAVAFAWLFSQIAERPWASSKRR